MNRLPAIQQRVQGALRRNADLLYRHQPVWSDGSSPRISVEEADPRGRDYARAVTQAPDLVKQDIRFIRYHPDDTPPGEGAACAFDGGRLELRHWGQVNDFAGTALGVAVWEAP